MKKPPALLSQKNKIVLAYITSENVVCIAAQTFSEMKQLTRLENWLSKANDYLYYQNRIQEFTQRRMQAENKEKKTT